MNKKILAFIIGSTFIFMPFIPVYAAITPDCGKVETITTIVNGKTITTSGITKPCDFDQLMVLVNKVINFLLMVIATPLAALAVCYAGFLMISAGDSSEKVSKAKGILKNVVIGYIVALAAWLIVKTILVSLGFNGPMFLK